MFCVFFGVFFVFVVCWLRGFFSVFFLLGCIRLGYFVVFLFGSFFFSCAFGVLRVLGLV